MGKASIGLRGRKNRNAYQCPPSRSTLPTLARSLKLALPRQPISTRQHRHLPPAPATAPTMDVLTDTATATPTCTVPPAQLEIPKLERTPTPIPWFCATRRAHSHLSALDTATAPVLPVAAPVVVPTGQPKAPPVTEKVSECVVCLEPLETRSYLPCRHGDFHATCVRRWLRVRPNCPLCSASAEPEQVAPELVNLTWEINERRQCTITVPRKGGTSGNSRKKLYRTSNLVRRAVHLLCLPSL